MNNRVLGHTIEPSVPGTPRQVALPARVERMLAEAPKAVADAWRPLYEEVQQLRQEAEEFSRELRRGPLIG